MQRVVVDSAERHDEFVAETLSPMPAVLRKAYVVGLRRRAAADEVGQRGHASKVIAVAVAPHRRQSEAHLFNPQALPLGMYRRLSRVRPPRKVLGTQRRNRGDTSGRRGDWAIG